jgi:3'-phosphoadenosine 5'-phosphosulfate (PAPS) 3'-phosphatase
LAGERGSSISIALLREGVPVLGVVHAPRIQTHVNGSAKCNKASACATRADRPRNVGIAPQRRLQSTQGFSIIDCLDRAFLARPHPQ